MRNLSKSFLVAGFAFNAYFQLGIHLRVSLYSFAEVLGRAQPLQEGGTALILLYRRKIFLSPRKI